jgi:ABC-type antimicrobial peptide transport system permease subunit
MDFSDPDFEDLRNQSRSFRGFAEFSSSPQAVSNGQEPMRTVVSAVSHDFFQVMGVQPIQGREFVPEEQQFNAPMAAIISDSYWKQSLGGSSNFSAMRLKLGGQSASVIGVMPPGFRFPENTDIWVPRELYERYPSRTAHNWSVLGRLAGGQRLEAAHSELSILARRLKQQYGQDAEMVDVSVERLRNALTGNVRTALVVLLAASGFLLLIACANVANLMLAQAAARERELTVRAALGASRGRLIRQFLTEALLLSFLGCALGVFTAIWGLDGLLAIAPSGLPRLEDVSISWPVLLFSLAAAVLIAAALGMICAWKSASGRPADVLKEGGRLLGDTPQKQMVSRVMTVGQLITAMVLLVGASLMGRSLLRVLGVDPGFKTENVLTMELDLPDEPKMPHRVQVLDDLFARLRIVPGVEEVGGDNILPLLPGFRPDGGFVLMNPGQISPRMEALIRRSVEGSLEKDPASLAEFSKFFEDLFRDRTHLGHADFRVVSQEFFTALSIPLVRGRLFDDRDAPDAQHVAVISESLARETWPNQDPIGQTIEFGNMDGDPRLLQIVGVVGNVREDRLEVPPRQTVYVNYRQRPRAAGQFNFMIRTSGDSAAVFSAFREIVRSVDPNLSPRFNTLSKVYSASLENRRFSLTLVAIFSLTALLLAMAGIYGVNAYSVAQRTREIGVRMALGASAREIMSMIVRQGLATAAAGVFLGTLGSLALTRWMQSLLFEVSSTDPATFCGVAVLLALSVLLACWIPARYASRVDPMVALRYE